MSRTPAPWRWAEMRPLFVAYLAVIVLGLALFLTIGLAGL